MIFNFWTNFFNIKIFNYLTKNTHEDFQHLQQFHQNVQFFLSLILISKFFVLNFDKGISFHLVFAIPIPVSTRLFPRYLILNFQIE